MVCAAWRARTRRDREHEEQHEHGQRRGSERAERGQVAVAAAREAAAAALAMIDRCDAPNSIFMQKNASRARLLLAQLVLCDPSCAADLVRP